MEEEFVPRAKERADVSIVNMMEKKDYRMALKTLKKRLEKNELKRYRAWAILCQARHPFANERGEALLRIQELASQDCKEKITNRDHLEVYEEACLSLAEGGDGIKIMELMGEIRVNAVQAKPEDEDFAAMCLKNCVLEGNFECAFKIYQHLMKEFPSNGHYAFSLVTIRLLLSQDPRIAAGMRPMHARLAIATLDLFAKMTIGAKDGAVLPPKSLKTGQEILLYHIALKTAKFNEKLIEVLMNPKIGVFSDLIKGNWSMTRSLIDELHHQNGDPRMTIDLCIGLLQKACANEDGVIVEPMCGDWIVWDTYIAALMRATDYGHLKEAHGLLERFLKVYRMHINSKPAISKTNNRNARMAYMKFMTTLNPAHFWDFEESPYSELAMVVEHMKGKIQSGLPQIPLEERTTFKVNCLTFRSLVVLEYLHDFGHLPAVFADVKPSFVLLSAAEREMVLIIAEVFMVQRRGWIAHQNDNEAGVVKSPPILSVPDQVAAAVNHFKLLYLDNEMVLPSTSRDEEHLAKVLETFFLADSVKCYNCRKFDPKDPANPIFNQRPLWCKHCLRNTVLNGVDLYDHALNGWAKHAWTPFRTLKTDMHPADDALIIAAMALIKLGRRPEVAHLVFPTVNREMVDKSFSPKQSYKRLFQAAAILEFAHQKSPANAQILLLLVRLYTVLGAGSLAMRAYTRLNLKQIQSETLGYVLFDRISTLHPHPCGDIMTGDKPVPFDPATELEKIQQRYRNFHNQIQKNLWTCLEKENYSSIFQLVSTQRQLHPSVGTVLSVVELRSLARMTNRDTILTKASHGYDILPKGVMNDNLVGNLDYKSFPSFELRPADSPEAFVHISLDVGPTPSDERMRAALLVDELRMVIDASKDGRASMGEHLLSLKANLDSYRKLAGSLSKANFTHDEHCFYRIAFYLIEIVTKVGGRDRMCLSLEDQMPDYATSNIRTTLIAMLGWTNSIEGTYEGIPDFRSILHPLYTRYNAVRLVEGVSRLLIHPAFQQNPNTPAVYQMLVLQPALDLYRSVMKIAKVVKKGMDKGGHIDLVAKAVEEVAGEEDEGLAEEPEDGDYDKSTIGRSLRRLLTPEFIEVFAGQLVASWSESVVGLQCL